MSGREGGNGSSLEQPPRDLDPQRSADQDRETNKEMREQVRHLQKEAFQLANYYFVFQGVIFTAFYNFPSNTKCRYRWIPLTLSVLAGTLNLCALVKIAFQYKWTLDDIDMNSMRSSRISQAPPQSGSTGNQDEEPIGVICERGWRLLYVVGCVFLVSVFLGVTIAGCWIIPCGAKTPNAAERPSPPTN